MWSNIRLCLIRIHYTTDIIIMKITAWVHRWFLDGSVLLIFLVVYVEFLLCLSSFCVLCKQCCQFLWTVHSWLLLWFSLTLMLLIKLRFSSLIADCGYSVKPFWFIGFPTLSLPDKGYCVLNQLSTFLFLYFQIFKFNFPYPFFSSPIFGIMVSWSLYKKIILIQPILFSFIFRFHTNMHVYVFRYSQLQNICSE